MFLKNRNISSKIKRSKVTDYAALKNIFLSRVLGLSQVGPFFLFSCGVCLRSVTAGATYHVILYHSYQLKHEISRDVQGLH